MRRQLVKTVTDILEQDERVVLLLGDIGVHGFREVFDRFPKRVYNIGILEQATVGLAAGLALDGMIPIFHTIAPFMVERALEQLKVDFGYQKLNGNFISVGASYDYASLGCTHHCPGDISILQTIPNMKLFVPGHPLEFDKLFRENYDNGRPNYFRLSERANKDCNSNWVRLGKKGIVIVTGPMLDTVVEACRDLDVSILYRNELSSLHHHFWKDVVVVEPCYEGTSAASVSSVCDGKVLSIGVPCKFLTNYGSAAQHDDACGLTVGKIRERIEKFYAS